MGPRGRGYAQGPLDRGTLRRAFKYVFTDYPLQLLIVAVLIGVVEADVSKTVSLMSPPKYISAAMNTAITINNLYLNFMCFPFYRFLKA